MNTRDSVPGTRRLKLNWEKLARILRGTHHRIRTSLASDGPNVNALSGGRNAMGETLRKLVRGPSSVEGRMRAGSTGLVRWIGGAALAAVAALCVFPSAIIWERNIGSMHVVLALLIFYIQRQTVFTFRRCDIDLVEQVVGPWAKTSLVLLVLCLLSGSAIWFYELLSWCVIAPIAQIATLNVLPDVLALMVRIRRPAHRVVVVGAGELSRKFVQAMRDDPIAHSKVIAIFDDRSCERTGMTADDSFKGGVRELVKFANCERVDQIYFTFHVGSNGRMVQLLYDLQDCTSSIYFVSDVLSFDLVQPRVDTHVGFPVISVRESPFNGVNFLVKRVSDLLVAITALMLLWPVMLAIALLIKLTSKGPVLFKQLRYGLDGREIEVWKFRSMTVTEDGNSEYTQVVRNDPRVTWLGAFLRRTSMDELPQLINVLQGRMSVVGPRPHVLQVNDQYRVLVPGYMVRHKILPGITGWAQVNGFRGGDDLGTMKSRIECDLMYLRGWSIWLDLVILWRTVSLVIRDSKAF